MTALIATSPLRETRPAADGARRLAGTLVAWISRSHLRRRAGRALMELSAEHRRDVGLDHIAVPSATQLEAAARRKLALGMPGDWC